MRLELTPQKRKQDVALKVNMPRSQLEILKGIKDIDVHRFFSCLEERYCLSKTRKDVGGKVK